MSSNKNYGRGFGFPLLADGRFEMVTGADAVAQSLWSLLKTAPGERVGRPGYGCGLHEFLFRPNTVATRTLMRQTIEEAIDRFEPRAELDSVEVDPDPKVSTRVHVDIRYRLADDPTEHSLIFPFYLEQAS